MPLVDIAVVTALAEELQTVREVFSQHATACGADRRGNIDADLFRLPVGSREYTICLASGFGMGGAKMAAFATDVFAKWRPVAAILTGIAGVVKTQWLQLGDVAVAEQVFAYSNVAVIDGQLVFRKSGYQVNSALRRAANQFRTEFYSPWQKERRATIAGLAAQVNETRPLAQRITVPPLEGGPQVFVESGASGPFLVRDAEFRDEYVGKSIDANIAWLEMEGDGFMESAHQADVKAIVIKGLSDPSDNNKVLIESETKGFWRIYAAANAASVVLETLKRSALPPIEANRLRYDFTLSPTMPIERGIAMFTVGAHNLGFPRLLLSKGSIVGARLTVGAIGDSGNVVLPANVSATIETGLAEPRPLQHSVDGNVVVIPIGDSDQAAAVSYVAAYREPVARLETVVTAPFYSSVSKTWTRT